MSLPYTHCVLSDEFHRGKRNGLLSVDVQRGTTRVDFQGQSTTLAFGIRPGIRHNSIQLNIIETLQLDQHQLLQTFNLVAQFSRFFKFHIFSPLIHFSLQLLDFFTQLFRCQMMVIGHRFGNFMFATF